MNEAQYTPGQLAEMLKIIGNLAREHGWIRPTQLSHIDLMIRQLQKAQKALPAA